MGSRLDVSPSLIKCALFEPFLGDSRKETELSFAAHFAAFSFFHFSALARTGAERALRFEWDL
jgi:hypothetical protein